MARAPYPGVSPAYQTLDQVGGLHRTCLVIDLRSQAPLSRVQLALLGEKLEATVERALPQLQGLERAEVVLPEQFDPVVCQGLRITRP